MLLQLNAFDVWSFVSEIWKSQSERSMNYENEKSLVSVSMVSTSHVLPTMCETDSALT